MTTDKQCAECVFPQPHELPLSYLEILSRWAFGILILVCTLAPASHSVVQLTKQIELETVFNLIFWPLLTAVCGIAYSYYISLELRKRNYIGIQPWYFLDGYDLHCHQSSPPDKKNSIQLLTGIRHGRRLRAWPSFTAHISMTWKANNLWVTLTDPEGILTIPIDDALRLLRYRTSSIGAIMIRLRDSRVDERKRDEAEAELHEAHEAANERFMALVDAIYCTQHSKSSGKSKHAEALRKRIADIIEPAGGWKALNNLLENQFSSPRERDRRIWENVNTCDCNGAQRLLMPSIGNGEYRCYYCQTTKSTADIDRPTAKSTSGEETTLTV